jgi:predicted Rossmann fold nucleotide-binding protein DprA/Smf involved in DNA uptake
MRNKEKLKTKILEIVEDNKPEIVPVDEIKKALNVKEADSQEFQQALIELENEGKIRMHIAIP